MKFIQKSLALLAFVFTAILGMLGTAILVYASENGSEYDEYYESYSSRSQTSESTHSRATNSSPIDSVVVMSVPSQTGSANGVGCVRQEGMSKAGLFENPYGEGVSGSGTLATSNPTQSLAVAASTPQCLIFFPYAGFVP